MDFDIGLTVGRTIRLQTTHHIIGVGAQSTAAVSDVTRHVVRRGNQAAETGRRGLGADNVVITTV